MVKIRGAIESAVGLRKCPYYHNLAKKRRQNYKHSAELAHIMAEKNSVYMV